jgi:hypothetical protein
LDTALRRAFTSAERAFPKAVSTPLSFRVTAGDEFQWVVSDVRAAFDFLTYVRAFTTQCGLDPFPRFRAAIGVGGISVTGGRGADSYQQDGEAFVRARRGLERLQKRGSESWTALITGDARIDRTAEVIFALVDYFQQKWTVPQWEAIRWALLGFTRERIAGRVRVAHQNVTKRLKAAQWQRFEIAAQYLREILQESTAP